MLVLVSRCNPHLVDASSGAIHHAGRHHMIKYEMIMGHFTAQRCLFGWNSMVVSEKSFSRSVRACMGMGCKKKKQRHSRVCLVRAHKQQGNSGSTHRGWQAAETRAGLSPRWIPFHRESWQHPLSLVPLGTAHPPISCKEGWRAPCCADCLPKIPTCSRQQADTVTCLPAWV